MSDNRRPETDKDTAAYHSLVAYINAVYCETHGYDFAYYQPYLSDLRCLTTDVPAELVKSEDKRILKRKCLVAIINFSGNFVQLPGLSW